MSQFTVNRAGRPHKGERKAITVRVPEDIQLKARLEAVAKVQGLSVSDLVSNILEDNIGAAEIAAGLPHQGMFDLEETG